MNASELAQAMLLWEQKQRELDMLEAEIKAAVLAIGKTQTVGNVRASYSAGRKSYDYRGAIDAAGVLSDALDPYTTIIPETINVDFRAACLGLGIVDVPFTQSEPSVTVKLQD